MPGPQNPLVTVTGDVIARTVITDQNGNIVATASPGNADGLSTTPLAIYTGAYQLVFNGATWDRMRSAQGAALGRETNVALGTPATSSLSNAAATGPGSTVDYRVARRDHSVMVTGAFVGTLRLQGSLDNATFFDLVVVSASDTMQGKTLDINGTGLFTVPAPIPVRYVRATVTSLVSGSITAVLAASG